MDLLKPSYSLKVLIVGGGDGGIAREVAKYPTVENIDQVEIDERVVELCKEYIPSMAVGFNDPKVHLFIEDGFKFMQQRQNQYDVIITDSSDPVGWYLSILTLRKASTYYRGLERDSKLVNSKSRYNSSKPELLIKY